ncbi:MAG TPA: winged helix-turn-helix domain-containing protein [Desulfobacteraceae bacterium]|nr:winged helix-turn-helix domain-containing protein [Desulfobacteraceae bacterium]
MTVDPARKQALKDLRSERRQWVEAATAASRSQKKTIQAIRKALENAPATVPQIAEAVGMPTGTVLWFVAGMKKYGQVVEAGEKDSYFRYALAQEKPAEAEA